MQRQASTNNNNNTKTRTENKTTRPHLAFHDFGVYSKQQMVAVEQQSNTLNGLTDTRIKYEKLICNKYPSNYGITSTDSIQYTFGTF